jgi:hypothetical protein
VSLGFERTRPWHTYGVHQQGRRRNLRRIRWGKLCQTRERHLVRSHRPSVDCLPTGWCSPSGYTGSCCGGLATYYGNSYSDPPCYLATNCADPAAPSVDLPYGWSPAFPVGQECRVWSTTQFSGITEQTYAYALHCVALCEELEYGFTVAGILSPSECICGTAFDSPQAGNTWDCSYVCAEDGSACGGPDRVQLYTKSQPPTPTPTPTPTTTTSVPSPTASCSSPNQVQACCPSYSVYNGSDTALSNQCHYLGCGHPQTRLTLRAHDMHCLGSWERFMADRIASIASNRKAQIPGLYHSPIPEQGFQS